MESSEDDAGAATSASRRASAREKDVGLAEDVDTTLHFQHELSETRGSCGTPTMSEDNFDGDSIPSPSAKDTSTEAILDMIDDLIGDPRVPRRVPLVSPTNIDLACGRAPTPPVPSTSVSLDSQHNKQPEEQVEEIALPPCDPSPTIIANSESHHESVNVLSIAKCSTPSEILISANTSTSANPLQMSSPVQVGTKENCSTQEPEIIQNVEPEMSTERPIVAPTLNDVENIQDTIVASECENLDRTVKCVTSSENRDDVTVELAESTSSECSVSESKLFAVEPTLSRSPLKRRLIRPAPSDRRPDSTVSSTADSQIPDILTTEQTSSETITKDVSSSSDAMPNVHGTSILDEISKVSEISICKAETSTTPTRKIKLVRPKVTSVISNSLKTETQIPAVLERECCQSTSDDISTPSLIEPLVEASSSKTVRSEEQESRLESVSDNQQQFVQIAQISLDASSNSQEVPSNEVTEHSPKVMETLETPKTLLPIQVNEKPVSCAIAPPSDPQFSIKEDHIQSNKVDKQSSDSTHGDHVLNAEKNVPLAKLCLSVAIPSESETTKNILEAQCSRTHIDKTQNSLQDEKTLLSPSVDQSIRESSLTINCEGDSEKTDHKKVPPIKLNLTDHLKNSDLMSSVKTLNIMGDDELTSHKSEDSLKQVPKLTIKLTNKYNQGAKSPVPKLTIKPLRPPAEQNIENSDINQQMPSVTNINIKPIPMPDEKLNESESNPVLPTSEQNISDSAVGKEIPSATKVSIKAIPKPTEKGNEDIPRPLPSAPEQVTHDSDTYQEISSITKINIKPIPKETEQLHESLSKPLQEEQSNDDAKQQIPSVTKINIKSITKPLEEPSEDVLKPLEQSTKDIDTNKQVPSVTKINIKPIAMPKTIQKQKESEPSPVQPDVQQNKDDHDTNQHIPSITKIHIKPIIKPNERINESISKQPAVRQNTDDDKTDPEIPNVTKLTIKPILKPTEKDNESTSLTSETSHTSSSVEQMTGNNDRCIPNVTKINIKPIPKPTKHVNDNTSKPRSESVQNDLSSRNDQIPNVTKLNIKPIVRPPEKINEMHRKSSSSEISESEYSENDESTSTSDQASTSDQGPLDSVPKVTIKLGKPGTESEGKFYTEKNVPKVTMKNVLSVDKDDHDTKSKLKMTYSDDNKQLEKIPKITIKTVIKPDSQPLSPKLTIKPLKPPDNVNKDGDIPKLKISTDSFTGSAEVKENQHVPKIIIKPVTKTDPDVPAKTPKKSTVICGSSEHIPVVTKLNIKPILKPTESGETSERFDEKVPVVSKLNIKPVIKPKDIHVDPSIEDVPKVIKLNIKPLKNPEVSSSEEKDCDEMNADMKDSIPVVTKLNIKPIVKPIEEEVLKDSENQSSETGNSSDDNADHIPIVTKINIKPIVKPSELEQTSRPVHSEQCIPVVTKLNIKPLVKPEEISSPSSPKKELLRSPGNVGIPVVTKLNIKPIVKPEDLQSRDQDENLDKSGKHSLVMKINVKNVSESMSENEHLCNNINLKAHSPKMPNSPRASKRTAISESNMEHSSKTKSSRNFESVKNTDCKPGSPSLLQPDCTSSLQNSCEPNVVSKNILETNPTDLSSSKEQLLLKPVNANETVASDPTVSESEAKNESIQFVDSKTNKKSVMQINEVINEVNETNMRIAEHYNVNYTKPSVLNCTLLKQLLSSTKEVDKSQGMKPSNSLPQPEKPQSTLSNCNESNVNEDKELQRKHSPKPEKVNDFTSSDSINMRSIQDVHKEANESVTKPLEIITDKMPNQDSGQDSPRIILKINKTDHGASAKIITEETHKSTDCSPSNDSRAREDIEGPVNATASPKKHVGRRKAIATESPANLTMGKRLRSSRIVESAEKSPAVKRNVNKRSSATETISPPQHKESELSVLESKKMKLEQILSANKSLTITPVVSKVTQTSPSKSNIAFNQGGKVSHNHSLLNNENCSQKNGNSKLHNILSNLQAKQMQTLQLNDANTAERTIEITTEIESNTSTGSSDVVVEITRVENYHPEVQEMLINENSICDLTGPEEVSQDPLEVESVKTPQAEPKESASIQTIEVTPTPRKRGRPRKLPLADTAKPPTPAPLPVPALEERPQRSLRLMRERPAILRKPRGGRGRGRGGRRAASPAPAPAAAPSPEVVIVVEMEDPPIDPTSSRIKLPRMTEALDKSVAGAQTDLKLFSSAVVLESPKGDEFMKSPEAAARPRSGRGSRGGRGRTPRNRGRGRGGGRGAMYMKETMGIYGRVCGPATTTVQLFEEETCMMDDNATPSKPSHLLDEDSQSSVKSSTNDSNKKSKFADLFDSNKVWTAADVKEYMWPPPDTPNAEPQMVMIQEQVAMFLGVKSFKRRYPELKRRTVGGDERDYLLTKGIVSEALCDLGITAVDASEVLDIMLSDYPHKYEEYRSHQRERQIASSTEEVVEIKTEERATKVEIKSEKTSEKPEPPKVDPEKARLDMAAAAIASAAEWNARANQWRRPACVDLQSNTVHRRRPPIVPPRDVTVCPPAGFYPHALLPGQYQHWYRVYTADQLRYFPLNTVLAAPPAAPSPADSSSDSEGSWGERSSSSDDSDAPQHHAAKRKKLSRVKRSSQQEKEKEESREPEVDTCRVCKLRLEANRKHTHERFLVCANCNAKLHPLCVELPADTIRKCREYAWQCAECKTCCSCRRPQDDDKMLFCDLCDRGFHIYCVGLDAVPSGRWHCVECAICKSCGARDPNGLNPGAPGTPGPSTPGPSTPGVSTGEWHHQTRRGPGGHKVYSHSLCTPCARAYRIGRYCPLCERSFIGPKGTMQLVICKLCDRQLHQECVKQTVAALRVLDYTCAECRRGGITSRAAAVRAAPRTIATLFMAKRRFNKYAHRQYMASRLQALDDPLAGVGDAPAPSDLSGDAPAPSDLSGDVPAPSELSGDVPAPSDLSGDAPAASDLSGDVPAPSDLSGDVPAPSEHSGD